MFFNLFNAHDNYQPGTSLEELTIEFLLKNDEAVKGLKLINKYLRKNDVQGLANLLRHHHEKEITDSETWSRDYVDFFIRYFSIVSVAYIVGYITRHELKQIESETALYLGNSAIKRYYEKNYRLLLPKILLRVTLTTQFDKLPDKDFQYTKENFQAFLELVQSIGNDDVYQFQWFLDGGSNGGYDLDDLNQILSDPEGMIKFMNTSKKPANALAQAIRGFFDFLIFIKDFNDFLFDIKSDLNKSAYWTYYSYWFEKINTRMMKSIRIFFNANNNIQDKSDTYRPNPEVENLRKTYEFYSRALENLVFTPNYKKVLEAYYKKISFVL